MRRPECLRGVMALDLREAMTAEDYARAAQVNPSAFDEEMGTRMAELDADQVCALFDLAHLGEKWRREHAHRVWQAMAAVVSAVWAIQAGARGLSWGTDGNKYIHAVWPK